MSYGISSLKALSVLKAGVAADEAADAANKGRELVLDQKNVRARQQSFERMVGDKTLTEQEYATLNDMLGEVDMSKNGVDYTDSGILGNYEKDGGGNNVAGSWKATIDAGSEDKTARDNANKVEQMRKNFDGELKDLESQDRLNNFDIQELMSRYTQNEQLASSLEKGDSDASKSIIQKIG